MKTPIIQLIPINIIAHPDSKSQYRCGIFGKKSPGYDNGGGTRKWRCLDTGEAKAYVVAEAPRVCCKEHGVVTAFVPWARHKSRFCSSFEDTVAWLAVNNHDTNSVIWCSIGYKNEVLQRFFDGLTPKQRESIRCVSADGARWIADCVKEYCPNDALCIDPFHVVS